MSKNEEYQKEAETHLLHAYNRYPVVMDHGEGVYLYDVDGNKYLDFGAGIAVSALGYSNEEFKKALKDQIDKGIHFSNFFYSQALKDAAKAICKITDMEKVFLANSGTEANEGALKLARKYARMKGKEDCYEVISMNKAFHGRSMGALSVTGTKKYREPFEPLIRGVKFATFNDLESVKALVSSKTCAIILEAVQGEGGIYPATKEFMEGIRKICDEKDILMICDEIQCGMGRCGTMFAFEQFDIRPDVITMAKGVGNGATVGCFATSAEIAKALEPGDHGTTFGGNPLACRAVAETIHQFHKWNLISHVNEVGTYMKEQLLTLKESYDCITDVRGMGLMLGMEVTIPVGDICKKALEEGLIVLSAGHNVVRFVPPLILEKKHVDEMIRIMKKVLG